MPNVRLTVDNNQPLFIPAHSIRLVETILEGSLIRDQIAHMSANSVIIYDIGEGLVFAFLITSSTVVAEQVNSDPKVHNKLMTLSADIGDVYVFPNDVRVTEGVPPKENPNGPDATISEEQAQALHEFKARVKIIVDNPVGKPSINTYVVREDPESIQELVDSAVKPLVPTPKRK